MAAADWLPGLITLGDSGGEWPRYLDALYAAFNETYRRVGHEFAGTRISLRRFPEVDGRHGGFYHLITEGDTEATRVPAMRRCERILWPSAIIKHAGTEDVLGWRKTDQYGETVILALADFSYVVVLRARSDHLLLVSAYDVENERRRTKLRQEYERCEKC